MILLNPIDWTEEGFLSAAHRYSSPERINDFLAQRPENQGPPGPQVWGPLDDWPGDPPYAVMARMLWRLYITPSRSIEVGYVRDGAWTTVVPLPAESDCDETGLCRCGCGLRAGTVSQ